MSSKLCSAVVVAGILGVACMDLKTAGLETITPRIVLPVFSTRCRFVEVADTRPTFEWSSLSRRAWIDHDSRGMHVPLEDITYELRIWRHFPSKGVREVYSVQGLTTTKLRLSEPLSEKTEFLWSVRAHFTVVGKPRVSEWALAGLPMRAETVPNESCLRFKTP